MTKTGMELQAAELRRKLDELCERLTDLETDLMLSGGDEPSTLAFKIRLRREVASICEGLRAVRDGNLVAKHGAALHDAPRALSEIYSCMQESADRNGIGC